METLARTRGLLVGAMLMFAAITLAIVVIGIKPSPAATAQEQAATINRGGGCSTGTRPGAPSLFTFNDHSVTTSSGTTKLTCFFEGPPISETVVDQGFLCNTYLGLTTESRYVYTSSGKGTLVCRINPGG